MAEASIEAATSIGAVQLTVADLDVAQRFYERVIGLRVLERSADSLSLGVAPDRVLVEIFGSPDAPVPSGPTTGLFHLALLVPSRRELARSLRRVLDQGWPLTGASDHLVSEAVYLDDPEGNGIELYRDRPRDEWRYRGGTVEMATEPPDLPAIMAELGGEEADGGMPPKTRVGHVHLRVSDLRETEAFYHGTLGFDVTVRSYPGALFLSAGGYHHHVGANTWHSAGAPSPPPGSRGLRSFGVLVPDAAALERVRERLEADRRDFAEDARGVEVRDPSGNALLLAAGERAPAAGP